MQENGKEARHPGGWGAPCCGALFSRASLGAALQGEQALSRAGLWPRPYPHAWGVRHPQLCCPRCHLKSGTWVHLGKPKELMSNSTPSPPCPRLGGHRPVAILGCCPGSSEPGLCPDHHGTLGRGAQAQGASSFYSRLGRWQQWWRQFPNQSGGVSGRQGGFLPQERCLSAHTGASPC